MSPFHGEEVVSTTTYWSNFMKWRDFPLDWCYLCETVYYLCEKCQNSSCGGGGCDFCMKDWEDFKKSEWYNLSKFEFYEKVYLTI